MNTVVNFFWRGNSFTYLHRLTLLSHVAVGHRCIMWLSGLDPKSEFWINNISEIEIRNADDIIDVTTFLEEGGNLKTASDLWSFSFLWQHGGIYSDTDAMAIKPWPTNEWIAVSCDKQHPRERLSIGVMAAPPQHEVFSNCIAQIKHDWGNVGVFADAYKDFFGHTNSTHDDKLFYPFRWQDWNTLLTDIEIPDVYSIHLYHTMFERNNMIKNKEDYNPNTLIGRLIQKFHG